MNFHPSFLQEEICELANTRTNRVSDFRDCSGFDSPVLFGRGSRENTQSGKDGCWTCDTGAFNSKRRRVDDCDGAFWELCNKDKLKIATFVPSGPKSSYYADLH